MNKEQVCKKLKELTDFSEESQDDLEKFINFLIEYNQKINLVGKSTIDDIWFRHILDSAQLIKYISKDKKVADFGTGAGFPGIVLSILGVKEISLFEKSFRKCEFLNEAKNISKNKISVFHENVFKTQAQEFDILTCRALASLNKLFNMLTPFMSKNSTLILLKGKKIHEEIKEAKKSWKFDFELFDSLTSDEGKVVVVKNVLKK